MTHVGCLRNLREPFERIAAKNTNYILRNLIHEDVFWMVLWHVEMIRIMKKMSSSMRMNSWMKSMKMVKIEKP